MDDYLRENVGTCAPGILRLLSVMLDVNRAIEHLHKIGICHNDITPSNVLISVNEGVSCNQLITVQEYSGFLLLSVMSVIS